MDLEESIKSWVTIDNKIKMLNEELRSLRENKNKVTENLVTYALDHNIQHKTIEITDGSLRFNSRKEPGALTFKLIKSCLLECIDDESQVDVLINYIKEKRETKIVNELKRTYK
jgi:hypothetical protein